MKTVALAMLAGWLLLAACGGGNDYECTVTCTAGSDTWGEGEDPIAVSASSTDSAATKCETEPVEACGTSDAAVVCSCTKAQ
jgi:hypothetical protein